MGTVTNTPPSGEVDWPAFLLPLRRAAIACLVAGAVALGSYNALVLGWLEDTGRPTLSSYVFHEVPTVTNGELIWRWRTPGIKGGTFVNRTLWLTSEGRVPKKVTRTSEPDTEYQSEKWNLSTFGAQPGDVWMAKVVYRLADSDGFEIERTTQGMTHWRMR